MDLYRVDEHCVKTVGDKFHLKSVDDTKNKKMLKIQIDSSISGQIGPKDVMESLKKCDNLEDEQTVKIKGKEYTVCLVNNKSDLFFLGKGPEESFCLNDNFFGTIHVTQKLLPTHSRLLDEVSWNNVTGFKGFHRNVPLGSNLDSS